MKDDALEVVALRNEFYRDNYRRALMVLLVLVLTNVCLVGVVYYFISHKPAPVYFAVTQDGSLTKMYALSEPIVSQSELLAWANSAVVDAYTFNFLNWRKEFQKISELFTPNGWENFSAELQRTKTLDLILKEKLSATAVATGAPTIANQAVLNGRYTWQVTMPILVTYESKNVKIPQPLMVTLNIRRVSTLDTPRGIAIESFNSVERTSI